MATTQAAAVQQNIVQMLSAGGVSPGGASGAAGSEGGGSESFTDALMANMQGGGAEPASAGAAAGGSALPEGGETLPPEAVAEPQEAGTGEAAAEEVVDGSDTEVASDRFSPGPLSPGEVRAESDRRRAELLVRTGGGSPADEADLKRDRLAGAEPSNAGADQRARTASAEAGRVLDEAGASDPVARSKGEADSADQLQVASADRIRGEVVTDPDVVGNQSGSDSAERAESKSSEASAGRSAEAAATRAAESAVRGAGGSETTVSSSSEIDKTARTDAVQTSRGPAQQTDAGVLAGRVTGAAEAEASSADEARQDRLAAETMAEQREAAPAAATQASPGSGAEVVAAVRSDRQATADGRVTGAVAEAAAARATGSESRSAEPVSSAAGGEAGRERNNADSGAGRDGAPSERSVRPDFSNPGVARDGDGSGPFKGFATAAAMIAAQSSGAGGGSDARAAQQVTAGYQQLQQLYKGEAVETATLKLPQRFGSESWGNSVSQRVTWMAGQQIGRAELRLDPPELGSLNIRLSIQHDQASVSFSSPHASVREVLEQQMPRLREMLAENGIDLQQSDVSDQSASGQSAGERDESDGRAGGRGQAAEAEQSSADAVALNQSLSLVDYYA